MKTATTHPILDHEAIGDDLRARVAALGQRYAVVIGAHGADLHATNSAAEDWRRLLCSPTASDLPAQTLLENLIDPRERREPKFWATPLGRALAWWTGGEEVAPAVGTPVRRASYAGALGVPRAEAAAALGMTRQSLHEWLGKDPRRLDPLDVSPTGISSAGLLAVMRERYPLEGRAVPRG